MIGSSAARPTSAIVLTATTLLWYIIRSTGPVAVVLLTANTTLGLLAV